MRIIRRFLQVFISFIFVFCLIVQTGCNNDYAKEPEILIFWHNYTGKQGDIFEMLVDTYNATEGNRRNVKIVTEYKSQNEIDQYIHESMDSNNDNNIYPNISIISKEVACKAKTHNLIVNAEKYLSDKELSGYNDGFLQEGRITGTEETYIFPISKASPITIINDSIWRKFYIDNQVQLKQWNTWAGITDLAKEYYNWSGGKALLAIESIQDFVFAYSAQQMPPIVQAGNKEIKINTNKETLRGIWDFYYVGVVNGYILQTDNIQNSLEKTEIVAYIGELHDPSYYPQTIINENGDRTGFLIAAVSYPTINENTKVYPHAGEGVCVFDNGNKANQESYNFLHWFCSNENIIQFSVANNEISSYEAIYKKSSTNDYFKQLSLLNYNKYYMLSKSLTQVSENKSFSPTGFIGYDSFCDEITESLKQTSYDALENVRALENNGMSHTEAVNTVVTEAAFEEWYLKIINIANKY